MIEKVESVWGKSAVDRGKGPKIYGWLDSPLVLRRRVHPILFGEPEGNWLPKLVEQLGLPRNGRWLSIGCGGGGLEIFAVEQGLCSQMDGFDVASEAIAVANRTAEEKGLKNVSFRVADLERSRLPENEYDVILCCMGLHHISRLEFFYEEAVRALRPGGWLLLNEFVGPSQWQWTDAQLEAINSLLAEMPQRYRVHAITGEIKDIESRPTIEFMNQTDPSESVRSSEILPLLQQQFDIVHQRDYGGAVLHKLLEFIVGNFDQARPEDEDLLRHLGEREDALMGAGLIRSDFTVVAARNLKRSLRLSTLPFEGESERHTVYGLKPIAFDGRGLPFRWTDPDASFVLRRPDSSNCLKLRLAMPPVSRCLTVSVDGAEVGVMRPGGNGNSGIWWDVAFLLPNTNTSEVTVRLLLDRSWSPIDIWAYGSPESFGVALAEAAIEQLSGLEAERTPFVSAKTNADGIYSHLRTGSPRLIGTLIGKARGLRNRVRNMR